MNNYETVIFLEIFLSLSSHWRTFQCTSKSEAYTLAADERNPELQAGVLGQANSVTEGAKAAAFIMLTNSVLYISQLHSFTKSCKVLILTEV